MRYLKQSTSVEVKVGPFLDETDGKTAETGLTISQADKRIAKNGGDWAQTNESTSLVHEENGWYRCLLDDTDTNTLGILMLAIHESGALPVWVEFSVVPANVYDSLFSTDLLQVHAAEISNDLITASSIAANAIGASEIADGAIDAGAFAADAITAAKIHSDVSTELNAGVLAVLGALNDAAADGAVTTTDTMVAYLKQIINTLEGAPGIPSFPAAASAANNVSLAEVIRAIAERLGVPSDLGGGATVAANLADIEGFVDNIPSDPADASDIAALIDALPTAAENADAVWDEDATAHQTGGTFGQAIGDPGASTETLFKAIVTDPAGTNIAADVIALKAETASILEDTGTTLQGEVDGIQADTEDIQSRLPAALTGDGNIKADTLRVGGTLQTAGDIKASLNTIDDFIDTEITALQTSVDDLPTNAELATALAAADDAVLAAIAALNNLSAAAVNAEVVDALATDTYAEPTGTPGATITLATKLGWLYMALRNGLTVTSTKKQFLDDGGAAEWEKDLSDDGTTYAESEGNAP